MPTELSSALLMVLVAASIFLAVVAVAMATTTSRSSKRMRRRMDRARPGRVMESGAPAAGTAANVRRMPVGILLGGLGHRFSEWMPHADAIRIRLAQGGIRLSVTDLAAILVALFGLLLLLFRAGLGLNTLISIGLGIIMTTALPTIVIGSRIRARRHRFLSQFPDAIDLIVRGVRSGLPVTEALHAVGQELRGQVGALFRDISGSIRLGKNLNEAMSQSTRILDLQEMRFFSISLAIQQETGGNLGEILHNLSTLMRRREQLKLKIKAMSSEARASAMIIGSLPFLMFVVIYCLDHDYIAKLFLDPRGWVLLGAGLTSLAVGLGVMAKMVRFEI